MLKINSLNHQDRSPGAGFSKLFCIYILTLIGLSCQSGASSERIVGSGAVLQASQPDEHPGAGVDANYLLGRFDPQDRTDFVKISAPYTDKPGMMLRTEAFEAFKTMWKAAKEDGVVLKIISSTRTFTQQKNIWENKWQRFAKDAPLPKNRALKILEYSAMPGSSRHHWGTDVDLNDLNNPCFEQGGKYEKVYAWLSAHAQEFGFCQPYTAGRPSGYQEEKWHWSYMPLSQEFLKTYQKTLSEADITGFIGSETAADIGIVQYYVLGINQACK